jgi:HSP20 family molecular chaperone IbpA
MSKGPREAAHLIHNLTTVGGSPVVFVMREVWHPPTDVYETEDAFSVRVEIAGMDEQDLKVTLSGDELTVCGHRGNDMAGYTAVHRLEMHYGDFETHVLLPMRVTEDRIEAAYRDGVLQILLPKEPAHHIPVGAAAD